MATVGGRSERDVKAERRSQLTRGKLNSDWKLSGKTQIRVVAEKLKHQEQRYFKKLSNRLTRSGSGPNLNSAAGTNESLKSGSINFRTRLSKLFNLFIECEEDCGICNKYIDILTKHVQYTHENSNARNSRSAKNVDNKSPLIRTSTTLKSKPLSGVTKTPVQSTQSHKTRSAPDRSLEGQLIHNTLPKYPTNTSKPIIRTIPETGTKKSILPSVKIIKTTCNTPAEAESTEHLELSQSQYSDIMGELDFEIENDIEIDGTGSTSEYEQDNYGVQVDSPSPDADNESDINDQITPTVDNLRDSHKTNTKSSIYTCNVCQKTFTDKKLFETHSEEYCERPAKEFELEKHKRKKRGRKLEIPESLKCEVCGYVCSRRDKYTDHMRRHTGKPCKCVHCDKSYATNYSLSRHVLTHSNEKLHTCIHCDKGFTSKDYLRRHLLTHKGEKEKPLACESCERRFSRKDNLEVHQRSHTGERPFKCEICDKCFGRSDHLKTHLAMVHRPHRRTSKKERKISKAPATNCTSTSESILEPEPDSHMCKECGKIFYLRIGLKLHLSKHHKKQEIPQEPESSQNQ